MTNLITAAVNHALLKEEKLGHRFNTDDQVAQQQQQQNTRTHTQDLIPILKLETVHLCLHKVSSLFLRHGFEKSVSETGQRCEFRVESIMQRFCKGGLRTSEMNQKIFLLPH